MNEKTIRDLKLESILVGNEVPIKWTKLDGCYATTDRLKTYLKRFEQALFIETDYFGGSGEQFATLYEWGQKIDIKTNSPINEGLRKLGIVRTNGNDKFDTIGLGNYRSNRDFD